MKGRFFVFSGSSGAGKTTLVGALSSLGLGKRCVTMTTRPPRVNEVNGIDYWFVDRADFEKLVASGELLEHAEVYGNLYGLPKFEVENTLSRGMNAFAVLDTQGAATVLREAAYLDPVTVFILSPGADELRRRLLARGDDPAVVEKRLEAVEREESLASGYKYAVRNEVFETALEVLRAIVTAETSADLAGEERYVGLQADVH